MRRARAEAQEIPGCRGLSLYLINPDFPQGPLSREEMEAVMERPAYWALCWPSGCVLARHLLDSPHLVRGKRVLDFGAGSGVVAVAAARAGAAEVVGCDQDPEALQAIEANARLNDVTVKLLADLEGAEGRFDLAVVADVLYDRDNHGWLRRLKCLSEGVLVGDSRVHRVAEPGFAKLAEVEARGVPDFDPNGEFRRVSLFGAGAHLLRPGTLAS